MSQICAFQGLENIWTLDRGAGLGELEQEVPFRVVAPVKSGNWWLGVED